MSKVCVEREAHFYLIDLADGTLPTIPSFYHPSSLAYSLAQNPCFYLRYDGVYVQKTRGGEDFFAYYRFYPGGKVSVSSSPTTTTFFESSWLFSCHPGINRHNFPTEAAKQSEQYLRADRRRVVADKVQLSKKAHHSDG